MAFRAQNNMSRTNPPGPITFLLLVASLLMSSAALGERTAPNGTLKPRRGPYAGQVCKYGDGSAEYTRLAEFTVAELLAFISGKKKPPPGAMVEFDVFLISMQKHDYDYGSQVAKEGYDLYKDLVQACLEDGDVAPDIGHCRHRAPKPIGISIYTGKAVAEYEMALNHLGYWIIEPGWVK